MCRAIVGLPVEEQAGELPVRVGDFATSLEVLPSRFNQRELTVASKYVERPVKVKKRMEADRKAFDLAYAQPFEEDARFLHNFELPVRSDVTAPFG